MSSDGPIETHSFVACVTADGIPSPRLPDAPGWNHWSSGGLAVAWLPRTAASVAPPRIHSTLPRLIVGDPGEWDAPAPEQNLAAAAVIHFDPVERALDVRTSIVGLPPVYVQRSRGRIMLASAVHLLARSSGGLELDPRSVRELGRVGHPLAHRTLFRDVELAPSGSRLRLTEGPDFSAASSWSLPESAPLDWPAFIEEQIAAFEQAITRLDVGRSFLSLTAGLDTRTVFSALQRSGRSLPAVTMTGPHRRSLDARAARSLCRAYGLEHRDVSFDARFTDRLPELLQTASRLSGGLASLDQSPDVFMYESVGAGFSARLSGNLGNQVGRGGTEGVSTRGARLDILAPHLARDGDDEEGGSHWLLEKLEASPGAKTEFILRQEVPFTLASNFPIGHHYATQQTPYASRALIETLARKPVSGSGPSGSMIRMRLRDLAHRFLGEPERLSFQRTLIHRNGGFAARHPINWGWRAAGGVSPAGLALGTATLFGMYARARGLDGGILRAPLAWSGLPALHDFRETRQWLRHHLRDFVRDTLDSPAVDAVLDRSTLRPLLDEHFTGRQDHHDAIVYALDLALAQRQFCAAPAA